MWQSPLRAELVAAQAHFEVYGSCELAARFGEDVLAEYTAVRAAVGLLDVSHRRKFRVTGSDRVSFLQGMLSNDVATLTAGQGCHATFLTHQGRVVADLRVYVLSAEVLLDVEPQAAEGLSTGLAKYLVADDVEIVDVTDDLVTVSIQGSRADRVVRAVTNAVPTIARQFDHVEVPVAGRTGRLVRVSEVSELGYEISVPAEAGGDLWRQVLECGQGVGLRPVGRAAYEILRVECGVPSYGSDMDESRIVLEVGLEDALSTSKGCYLGQEVVERASARGHVNRKLTGLRLTSATVPLSGAAVHADGKKIGAVTSAVDSPALGSPIALAYIRREFLVPGTAVTVEVPGGSISATVSSLPFYGG